MQTSAATIPQNVGGIKQASLSCPGVEYRTMDSTTHGFSGLLPTGLVVTSPSGRIYLLGTPAV